MDKAQSRETIEHYLKRNGIADIHSIKKIISGFDLSKPVYEQRIWQTDKLLQYVRNPSASFNEIKVGTWFSLKGATMDSLAIFGGGAGRNLVEFRVKYSIVGLEGIAKEFRTRWTLALGGKGGSTQIFIPKKLLFALEVL